MVRLSKFVMVQDEMAEELRLPCTGETCVNTYVDNPSRKCHLKDLYPGRRNIIKGASHTADFRWERRLYPRRVRQTSELRGRVRGFT